MIECWILGMGGAVMTQIELDRMSADNLWSLNLGHATVARKTSGRESGAGKALEVVERPGVSATTLSTGLAEILQPRSSFGNLVRPWQTAALAGCAAESGWANRRFQN